MPFEPFPRTVRRTKRAAGRRTPACQEEIPGECWKSACRVHWPTVKVRTRPRNIKLAEQDLYYAAAMQTHTLWYRAGRDKKACTSTASTDYSCCMYIHMPNKPRAVHAYRHHTHTYVCTYTHTHTYIHTHTIYSSSAIRQMADGYTCGRSGIVCVRFN